MGQRRNMNGAGVGGRLVANRNGAGTQLGNRNQRYRDLRIALGLSGG